LELVFRQPELTLQEIRGALATKHGAGRWADEFVPVSQSAEDQLGKRAYTPPSGIAPM
jgi:hypothetical protein